MHLEQNTCCMPAIPLGQDNRQQTHTQMRSCCLPSTPSHAPANVTSLRPGGLYVYILNEDPCIARKAPCVLRPLPAYTLTHYPFCCCVSIGPRPWRFSGLETVEAGMIGTSLMVTGSEITASTHHSHTIPSAAASRSVPVRDASVGWRLSGDSMTGHIYRHHEPQALHGHTTGAKLRKATHFGRARW